MTTVGASSSPKVHSSAALGGGQHEADGSGGGLAGPGEGVGEGAVGQAGDVPEPLGGGQVDVEADGDVAGVDPGLGQAGGGEGPGRHVAGDPRDPVAGRTAGQGVGHVLGAAPPAGQDVGARAAPLAGHRGAGGVVDGGPLGPVPALGDGGQVAAGRRRGQLVGLGQVEHHVGDGPALAGRGERPAGLVEGGEEGVQLGQLGAQGGEDGVHQPRASRPMWSRARSRVAAATARALSAPWARRRVVSAGSAASSA